MNINDFPKEMFDFFNYPSRRKIVTPEFLIETHGRSTFNLNECDIYVMGKRKGCRKPVFWTKLRITSREFERNALQGLLGVQFLGGFGFDKCERTDAIKLMRPSDIGKLVSEDNAVFKKRSVVDINGTFVALEYAESFCELPLMTSSDISSNGGHNICVNSRKRKVYAMKRLKDKKWAHANRVTIELEQKRSLHKMLLPYKKNIDHSVYFEEFMKDIMKNCKVLQQEFHCKNGKVGSICKDDKLEEEGEKGVEIARKEESSLEIDECLRDVDVSDLMW